VKNGDNDNNEYVVYLDKNLGVFPNYYWFNGQIPYDNYSVYVTDSSDKNIDVDVKTDERDFSDSERIVYLEAIIPLTKQKSIDDLNSGYNQLYDGVLHVTVTKPDNSNKEVIVSKLDLDVNLYANVLKKGCLSKNPTTSVGSDGKMNLFSFLPSANDEKDPSFDANDRELLFEIQDLLHYKAYLMDDGYTEDFLNDILDYAQHNTFLNKLSDLFKDFNMEYKIKNDQFKIVNDLGEPKTMGPGLYEVHVNMVFPKDSLKIKDANIKVVLNKVKPATNDNVFYYMPIDGRVGINNTSIDRQGYGIDFSGDSIIIDNDILNEQLISNLGSNSTPKSHIDITKSLDFSKMNGSKRGTILEARRTESGPVNNIALYFIPKLQYWTLNYTMKNKYTDQQVGLYYSLIYNNESQLSENSILPWFAKDANTKTDFTGQKLFDTYPKVSQRDSDRVSKIVYDATSVTANATYDIYAHVFGTEGSSLSVDTTMTENLQNSKINVSEPSSIQIETLSDVLDGIRDTKLCISNSANSLYTRVFVNEKWISDQN